jgi:Flp pilus assembly pilin Flp
MGTIAADRFAQGAVDVVEFLRRFSMDEAGSPATEYAIMASLIAVVLIGSFEVLSGSVSGLYNTIAASL